MAATQTVAQRPRLRKSESVPAVAPPTISVSEIVPRFGVVTLYGYGIRVFVERGHLILHDGIGDERRAGRFARVRHGLDRLVVIGADGMVSLAALSWLAVQRSAFVMLERNGSVLVATGPAGPSDARLRRAQALAGQSETGVEIARELIRQKIAGQERVARDQLRDATAADEIAQFGAAISSAETYRDINVLESRAAGRYWAAWRTVPISFPKKDLPRVPEHWLSFESRISPITGSQRLAANPANAMLNYLYALLEAEARLALAAVGLDPGLGFLHLDTDARDSLACDLAEPVRPQVDVAVLDWIRRGPLRRAWFWEGRTGNCRLMADVAASLAETIPQWRQAVAPLAEWVARTLWATLRKSKQEPPPATPLTQRRKREAKGVSPLPSAAPTVRLPKVCRNCGVSITSRKQYCRSCGAAVSTEQLVERAKQGRVAAITPEALAREGEAQRRQAKARLNWDPASQPPWLTEETYQKRIAPLLSQTKTTAIAKALNVSWGYASEIRQGIHRAHERHWESLARLVGVSSGE
ncbi:MAG TPA: CRISPR-associated endonuclease Cas1 [Bryobacteraceae bacterium]|jgi:CRISPR-associated protein Cas1|nr:CRISPR-associated endonuclease Cas1 [Bryobacteraceae bacterium]